jgi:hypothetical protein
MGCAVSGGQKPLLLYSSPPGCAPFPGAAPVCHPQVRQPRARPRSVAKSHVFSACLPRGAHGISVRLRSPCPRVRAIRAACRRRLRPHHECAPGARSDRGPAAPGAVTQSARCDPWVHGVTPDAVRDTGRTGPGAAARPPPRRSPRRPSAPACPGRPGALRCLPARASPPPRATRAYPGPSSCRSLHVVVGWLPQPRSCVPPGLRARGHRLCLGLLRGACEPQRGY